jgi:hypothetical protein
MYKKSVVLAFVIIMMGLALGGVVWAGKTGQAGSSNTAHLYLHEEDYTGADGAIVESATWGKMTYSLSGYEFDFVFNGHGLEPDMDYTLIYYPDPWPGTGLICLGSGVADMSGDVHIKGFAYTGDLPAEYDPNGGANILLVLTADVDCTGMQMTAWNPDEYLFGDDLITFDQID